VLPTGAGKCHARGTPILMYDGTIKMVEDIIVGDLLMGPDSEPRAVTSLARGREEMFRVKPTKGDSFDCNRSHILSLKLTPEKRGCVHEYVEVSIDDYLAKGSTFKHRAKLWRASIDFPSRAAQHQIPPYQLGLWLGDGDCMSATIHCPDEEVLSAWEEMARGNEENLRVFRGFTNERCPYSRLSRIKGGGQRNIVKRALQHLELSHPAVERFIPEMYKCASRSERLQILAGLIDTDGYLGNNYYEFSTMYKRLNDDVLYVARSLGLAAYSTLEHKTCQTGGGGWYYRIKISGHVDEIPVRIPRKKAHPRGQIKRVDVTGFKVESLGEGDYYGFTLGGTDGLYLLGDFTVTHNTLCFSYIAAGVATNQKRVLIVAHRRELLKQISRALKNQGVRHVVMEGGYHGIPTAAVVVASVFTIAGRLSRFPAPDLIIGDEAHHFTPKSTWGKVVAAFPTARVLGVTATPERADGKGLGLMFDTMIVGPTVAELTDEGFLSPAEVYAPSTPDLSAVKVRAGDYAASELEEVMGGSTLTGDAVKYYLDLAAGKKAVAFCVSVKHAQVVAKAFQDAGVLSASIDGSMDTEQRDEILRKFEHGGVDVLVSCDLISEGFDLPAVEVAILLRPTKSLSLYLQQVGRAIRIAPGKIRTVVLDHANNTRVHGFIDDDRDWELTSDTARKKKAKKDEEEPESVRTCPKCFAAHRPSPTCPKCGHVYESKARTVKVVEGELKKMERGERGEPSARDWQRNYYALVGKGKKMGVSNPKIWAFNIVCSQESKRLAGKRDVIGKPTMNGLTMDERETIKRAVGL
jgi:superfamily II DNA or RNA helicase